MSPLKDPFGTKASERLRVLTSVDAWKCNVLSLFRFGCLWKSVDDFEVYSRLQDQVVAGATLRACCLAEFCQRSECLPWSSIQVWWLQADGSPVHVELPWR